MNVQHGMAIPKPSTIPQFVLRKGQALTMVHHIMQKLCIGLKLQELAEILSLHLQRHDIGAKALVYQKQTCSMLSCGWKRLDTAMNALLHRKNTASVLCGSKISEIIASEGCTCTGCRSWAHTGCFQYSNLLPSWSICRKEPQHRSSFLPCCCRRRARRRHEQCDASPAGNRQRGFWRVCTRQ
eukprot:m.235817 g.235817  ORF g.235817 m.235817 type:complete len:183 (-) comp19347_c0_seq4:3010-3558(-)